MQTQILPMRQQNVIYFYDLPKSEFTSTKLATLIKQKTGVDVQQPQVRRELNKPFYTAVIRIDNQEQFERVKNEFRYFDFDGKPCRALQYCQDLLGINLPKLQEQNIFVRKIDKTLRSNNLENYFSKYGGIISTKISLNEDHQSRGYGFVCFQDAEYAQQALKEQSDKESFIGVKFAPKSRTDQRKVFNNIFVKNLPANVTDDDIKQLFGVYGNISSLHRGSSLKDPTQAFYFVCFTAEDKNDIEYGPRCAAKAVDELNGKLHEGQNLYVTAALKKQERQKELEHETLKYKSSKKRCNLYVKGFNTETEQDLRQIFTQFGEIESCRVFEAKDGKSPYAFVCFKTPDQAQTAKNCPNLLLNNKPLYVNHYEIKQYRDLKNEDNKDKQDFQRHQNETNPGLDSKNIDQLTHIIKHLMMTMKTQNPQQSYPPRNQYNNNQNNQAPGPYQGQRQPQPYPNSSGRGGYNQNNRYQGNNQQQTTQPVVRPGGMPPVPQQTQPPAPIMGNQNFGQPMGGVAQSAHPLAPNFYSATVPIVGAVNEMNPNYKQTVGGVIFEFVQKLSQYAPKVTGMLIDLPVVEIQKYMVNFDLFLQRIQQATQLLEQQAIAAENQGQQ